MENKMEYMQNMNMNTSLQNLGLTSSNLYDYYQPMLQAVYHSYPSWNCWHQPSKIEQAFKIVGKLIEKKLIDLKTVNDFVTTVNDVAELL